MDDVRIKCFAMDAQTSAVRMENKLGHSDISAVVLNVKTRLLAEESDVDGLAVQVRWLIDHPGSWPGLAWAARDHIGREYDARVQGRRLADIYRSLLEA